MKRITMLLTVVALMVVMLAIAVGPAFAFHKNPIFEDHPLIAGECSQGKCTGFGIEEFLPSGIEHHGEDQSEDPGIGRSGERDDGDTGDDRNDVCFDHGVCIGTNNN
jgi:hypothetical protein